ncbi:MAG: phytanoyl-CoA dioxygenase family protein [Granulosicoccus sp.]|nr:phytanoyl-CoA dioxygenase family protein [Granulosicoccus sp.]
MTGLSEQELAAYQHRGYVIPSFKLRDDEVLQLRSTVDILIENNPDVRPEHLVNAHIARKNAEGVTGAESILELTRHPRILDQVESVLGHDIILWGCQLFCKPAGDGMEVPWHQDGQYWPIRPLATCTVWIAIDDSVIENGCLRVIPGSHKNNKLFEHRTDNRERLTLTQTVNDQDMADAEPADVELKAGEMSLHDVYLIHGSNVNNSNRRRAGIAIRYMQATSVFCRDLIKPSDAAGFKVDFSQRPLWLLRGSDISGQNDFTVGH